MIHRKRAAVALILLAGCFAFYGCPVLVVTGAAVAGGTGTYYYVEGELRTDYYFPVPGVWSAVEKTIADMKRALSGIETIVLFTEPALTHVSSTLVRDLIRYGHEVTDFVPKGMKIETGTR